MKEILALLGDITEVEADVIVNAANRLLLPGAGVDGAIRSAGGPAITEETSRLGPLDTGAAVATTAGTLTARWVVHTVGPVWGDDDPSVSDDLLSSCYRTCLDLADDLGATSIAFPNISTGVYGYPPDRAAGVAVGAVMGWQAGGVLESVTFVSFDDASYAIYTELLGL